MHRDQSNSSRLKWYSFRWSVLFWLIVVLLLIANHGKLAGFVSTWLYH